MPSSPSQKGLQHRLMAPGRLEAERSINDGREEVSPIMTIAGEAADPPAIPAHHQPIAVMLDLMNPQRAGRWAARLRRQARCDEAGGTPHVHDRVISHRQNALIEPRFAADARIDGGRASIAL